MAPKNVNDGNVAAISAFDLIDLEDWAALHGGAQTRAALDDLHNAEDAMLSPDSENQRELTEKFRHKRRVFIELAAREKAASIGAGGGADGTEPAG